MYFFIYYKKRGLKSLSYFIFQNSETDAFLIRHKVIISVIITAVEPTWPRLETHRFLIGQSSPAGPDWPISDQSANPAAIPPSWTPITLHTWIGSRWPRHTQQTKAECLRWWNALCSSCDGQRHRGSVPGLTCPLRWRGGAGKRLLSATQSRN